MEGKQIRKIRKNYGIKAVTLAKESGIHYSRLSMIEHEHIRARQDEVDRLTEALSELAKGKESQ
jgi:predicted transcriptional regulator